MKEATSRQQHNKNYRLIHQNTSIATQWQAHGRGVFGGDVFKKENVINKCRQCQKKKHTQAFQTDPLPTHPHIS
jgi:hypothetical protein